MTGSEQRHDRALAVMRNALPDHSVVLGDACQLAYTGAFCFPVEHPRLWHYAAGYCTLGCALTDGIGAKLARPDMPVAVIVGDGGFMFTCQELVTGAELGLALPIVIWSNGGLKQIQDDMNSRDIPVVGVEGANPDFVALAKACGCYGYRAETAEALAERITQALAADRPTIIEVNEEDGWLHV